MRERLIELVGQATARCNGTFCWDCEYKNEIQDGRCCSSLITDHRLANGVIVPPCAVRDIVYMVTPGGRIHEKKVLGSKSVVGSNLRDEIWVKHSFTCESALVFNEDDIGKTVFLSREEAEQALKGGEAGA